MLVISNTNIHHIKYKIIREYYWFHRKKKKKKIPTVSLKVRKNVIKLALLITSVGTSVKVLIYQYKYNDLNSKDNPYCFA